MRFVTTIRTPAGRVDVDAVSLDVMLGTVICSPARERLARVERLEQRGTGVKLFGERSSGLR